MRGIQKPRVGLLNNGTEASKGDPLRKETYQLLSEDESIHFIGNVEARDLMDGVADVVVADGFTGNAVLKTMEGTAFGILKQLKQAIATGNWKAKLGAFLLKDRLKSLKQTLDFSDVGEQSCLAFKHLLSKRMVQVMRKRSIVLFVRFEPC